jgi:hypothetical protein
MLHRAHARVEEWQSAPLVAGYSGCWAGAHFGFRVQGLVSDYGLLIKLFYFLKRMQDFGLGFA